MNDIDEVRSCEESLRRAMLAGDVTALTDLLDDNLVFTGPDGSVLNNSQDLEAHASGALRLSRIEFMDASFHPVGDMVLTTTKAELAGSYGGVAFARPFVYTRLWSRSSGRWRVVVGHASVIGS